MPSQRSAAPKVVIFQWPCGVLPSAANGVAATRGRRPPMRGASPLFRPGVMRALAGGWPQPCNGGSPHLDVGRRHYRWTERPATLHRISAGSHVVSPLSKKSKHAEFAGYQTAFAIGRAPAGTVRGQNVGTAKATKVINLALQRRNWPIRWYRRRSAVASAPVPWPIVPWPPSASRSAFGT
jgi:hypothetical protein